MIKKLADSIDHQIKSNLYLLFISVFFSAFFKTYFEPEIEGYFKEANRFNIAGDSFIMNALGSLFVRFVLFLIIYFILVGVQTLWIRVYKKLIQKD